jgi:hypothetical protein
MIFMNIDRSKSDRDRQEGWIGIRADSTMGVSELRRAALSIAICAFDP